MISYSRSTKTPTGFLFLVTVGMLYFLAAGCAKDSTIEVQKTSEILAFIASDQHKGRHAFSPEIKVVEAYIANEFKKAGLKKLPTYKSFQQDFTISEYQIRDVRGTINGTFIQEDHLFGRVYSDSLRWTSKNTAYYQVQTLGPTDSFRGRFNELSRSTDATLVFVHSSHSDIFRRYQQYYSRPSRTLKTVNTDVVFVLVPDGFQANEDIYDLQIYTEKKQFTLANVTGQIHGRRSDEIVLFSAHHDHIGIRTAVEADSIANGANDNGSGVTAIIQLAHYFASLPTPERSIYFATFTAEEMGGYGSEYFSKQLNPDQIVAMFNIEMIGKPAVSGPNSAWITGYERSSFGQILSNSTPDSIYTFYPDPYPNQNLFFRSDNRTLARLGVPAHSISTTPIDVDQDYHQVSDEFDTINLNHLNSTIKAIARAAKSIISGADTPTRIDPETVN